MEPGTIKTRRWDDPIEPEDGIRLLVCRYRPRGLPKEAETWHEWQPALAPSVELHAAAYGKGVLKIPWTTYRTRYLTEMLRQKPAIAELAKRLREGQTITLLCSSSCDRESRCHRSLLKELIESELAKEPC